MLDWRVALCLRVESNVSICGVSRDYRVGNALCHALSFQSYFACHMLVATREFFTPDRFCSLVIDIDFDACDLNVGGLVGGVVCFVHCSFHLALVFHCVACDFRTSPAMVQFSICSWDTVTKHLPKLVSEFHLRGMPVSVMKRYTSNCLKKLRCLMLSTAAAMFGNHE